MATGCGDVLSLQDLKTAKLHQIFEAEVITGKQGGVAGGADIDYATNQVTGQSQKTMPAVLRDVGFAPATFGFNTGGTLTTAMRNRAVLWPTSSGGDGQWYYWEGALPKVIPANSTPASSGGVAVGAWRPVGDITLRTQLATEGNPGLVNDGNVAVRVSQTGAITRTQHAINNEVVSVLNWVAGDGVADDTVAFQAAVNSGVKHLFIPGGVTIRTTGTVTLPSGSFVLSGAGVTSVITSSAATVLKFAPASGVGGPVTEITGITFAPSLESAIMIDMTSVWSAAGRLPHLVRNCTFKFTGLKQTGVRLRGVWSARINDNSFIGAGAVNAKTQETGYGILVSLGDNMNTSVMNLQIENNSFTVLARPIRISARTLADGGRCEGIKIVGNNLVNGIEGISAVQTLAISITGNQISDFVKGATLVGCFDVAVSGNGEITGDENCIEIISLAEGFSERIAITGNNLNAIKTGGTTVRLTNVHADARIRNITISGNTMRGNGVAADTSYGVFFGGTFAIGDVAIVGNSFAELDSSVFFGGVETVGANTGVRIGPNSHNLKTGGVAVRFPERMAPRKRYTHNATATFTATAGQTSMSVDVTAAAFNERPVFADLQLTAATAIRAVYSYDLSTATSLVFNLVGTVPAGIQRYVLSATADSVYGY